MNFLTGFKTYIAGFGLLIKAVIGAILHFVDPGNALALDLGTAYAEFMTGLGLVGLRAAKTTPPAA